MGTDAIVIRNQCNFLWITSGGRGFIGLASENPCGCIVVSKDNVYLFANNIEAPRLAREELPEGFAEIVAVEWENDSAINRLITERIGSFVEDNTLEPLLNSCALPFAKKRLPAIRRSEMIPLQRLNRYVGHCKKEWQSLRLQACFRVNFGSWVLNRLPY